MEEFKKELADLLEKYNVAIICENTKHPKDGYVRIGFQDMRNGFKNEWTSRLHIGGFDLK